MKEILLALLTWIGANTDYNINIQLPNVVLTTPHNLCAQYGITHKGRCEAAGLRGFYNKKYTIYLGTDFDPTNPHHLSRLLHELVHYVQWQNGRHLVSCLGKLEVEAYMLQDNWRRRYKLPPILGEFKKILLSASCDA